MGARRRPLDGGYDDGTLGAMSADAQLETVLLEILVRAVAQNGAAPDERTLRGIAQRLAALVTTHGVPAAVQSEHDGDGVRPSDAECSARTLDAVGPSADALLTDLTKQLVKALFYPELRECRRSFEAVSADGHCRRQELDRARRRVSGTHCVDCPYWRSLAPERHREFLRTHWRGDPEALTNAPGVFLPEDFRALRVALAERRG